MSETNKGENKEEDKKRGKKSGQAVLSTPIGGEKMQKAIMDEIEKRKLREKELRRQKEMANSQIQTVETERKENEEEGEEDKEVDVGEEGGYENTREKGRKRKAEGKILEELASKMQRMEEMLEDLKEKNKMLKRQLREGQKGQGEEGSFEIITRTVERKERLRLPRMEGDNVKEGAIQQFLEKVRAKLEKGEEPRRVVDDMEEALSGMLYDTFRAERKGKEIEAKKDVEEILEAIGRKCLRKREGFEIINKLRTVGMRKEESVRAWRARVDTEIEKINPEERGTNAEYLKVDTFITGMRDEEIKERLVKKRRKIKTLKQAITRAEERESYLERKKTRREEKGEEGTGAIKVAINEKEYEGEAAREILRQVGWVDRGRREERGGRVTCFNCGGYGHYARDCSRWEEAECFRCGEYGHIAAECYAERCTNCHEFGHTKGGCGKEDENDTEELEEGENEN